MPSLFGLAPGGVCRAASVAGSAVRSYRTLSPLPTVVLQALAGLPRRSALSRRRAVCFLWHFPWGYPRRSLTGTVVSMEPGLSSPEPKKAPERLSGRLAAVR